MEANAFPEFTNMIFAHFHSELDATDLLSRILLHDPNLNDAFVEMVEDIHMKRRMMAIPFVLKSRNAKDKYIDSNFKNFLEEKSSELVNYGYDLVLRKLLISAIALEIALDALYIGCV